MLQQPSPKSHNEASHLELTSLELPPSEPASVTSDILSSIPKIRLDNLKEETLLPLVKEALDLAVDDLTLQRVGGVGAKGKSGAQIFMVSDVTGSPFVLKLFKDLEEYTHELASQQILSELSLSWFSVPAVIDLKIIECDDKAWGALLMTAAPGKPLDDRVKALAQAGTPEDYDVAMQKVKAGLTRAARAMAELHGERTGERPSEDYFRYQQGELDEAMNRVLGNASAMKFTGASVGELRMKVQEIFEAFRENPGPSALCHGDAGLGNVFYQKNTVTFIDLETFYFSIGSNGEAVGSAARDVVNMAVKLGYYGQQFGLNDSIVSELQAHFRKEYDKVKSHDLTPEAERFFATRILLAKLGKGDPSVDLHARLLFELLDIDRCSVQ